MNQEERLLRTMTWAGAVGAAFGFASAYLVLDYAVLHFVTSNFEPDSFIRTLMLVAFPAMVSFLLGHLAETKYYKMQLSN